MIMSSGSISLVTCLDDPHKTLTFKDVVNLFDHLVMMWRDARARRQYLLGQAALIDRRGRAINQRADLGTVRGPDDFCVVAVDDEHKVGGVKPRQEPSPGIRGWPAHSPWSLPASRPPCSTRPSPAR